MTSEQTFLLSIQTTDSAPTNIQLATFEQDYVIYPNNIGATSVTEIFNAGDQRIPFTFTLLSDSAPEGTEAFQVSISPEDTRDLGGGIVEVFPTSLDPLRLALDIFITIEDDDRKFQTLISCILL